jgi:hypothetical protein
MVHKRIFVIKVENSTVILRDHYVKKIYKNTIGIYYTRTGFIEIAKKWKYKRNCEKFIEKLKEELDPTKPLLKTDTLEIVEITDKQVLRGIKLKKLKK